MPVKPTAIFLSATLMLLMAFGLLTASYPTEAAQQTPIVPTTAVPRTADQIYAVAFSPDGSLCLTAGQGINSRVTYIWDVATGNLLHTLVDPTDYTVGVRFSSDGRYLFSEQGGLPGLSSVDHVVKLWDVETGEVVRTFPGGGLVVHPDGKHLITSEGFWEIETGTLVRALPRWYLGGVFSPDGTRLILPDVFAEGAAQLVDFETAESVHRFPGGVPELADHGYASVVDYTPTGDYILVGQSNGELNLWDAATLELHQQFTFAGQYASAVFSPNGSQIAYEDTADRVTIADVESGANIQSLTISMASSGTIQGIALSPDNRLLLVANGFSGAQLWDIERRLITSLDAVALQ